MNDSKGEIHVRNLRVSTNVGVPDEELAAAQEVAISLTMVPERALAGLGDSIDRTVDYFAVSQRVAEVAADGKRRLIETLVEDVGEMVMREFAVDSVEVELRKFILENADWVSVRITVRR